MRSKQTLWLYDLLAKLPIRLGYGAKFVVVLVVFGQLPILLVLGLSRGHSVSLVGLALAIVAGLGLGAWAIAGLLQPISRISQFLDEAADPKAIPQMPMHYSDRVGRLMRSVQFTTDRLLDSARQWEHASTVDPLTGVYNRRFAKARLEQDLSRARRESKCLTLLFMDIDEFKAINDLWGHVVGDECLGQLARTLRGQTREGDWVVRWGGDEFLVVLWNTSSNNAGMIANRIHQALADNPVLTNGVSIAVRVSMGQWEAGKDENADSVLSHVDTALLEAKREAKGKAVSPGPTSL